MLRRRSVEVNTHCFSGYRLCTEVVAACRSLTQPPPRRAAPGIFPVNEFFSTVSMNVSSFCHAAVGAARFCCTPARIDKALLICNNGSARKWGNSQTRQTLVRS